MCYSRSVVICCILLVVAVAAGCITTSEMEQPRATADLPATIAAALARAETATMAVPAATTSPIHTPRSSAAATALPPVPPTFEPRPTPTARSPLSAFWSGDRLEQQDPQAAGAIKALPWVADGVESTESAYVEGLVNLASDHPGIFHSLIGLSWVEGDIGQLEWAVIERIGDIAYYDVALAERVATLPWIGDGIVQPEPDTVDSLYAIATSDVALVERIIALTWVEDGVSQTEAGVVRDFDYISRDDIGLAENIVALSWVADDVTQTEASSIGDLMYIADYDVTLVAWLVDMPWVQDQLTQGERSVIEGLYYVARQDAAVARLIARKRWLADGVTTAEVGVINNLYLVAQTDMELAGRIVDMPFLETLEPPDVAAVEALETLAWYDPGVLREVLTYPAIAGGITDQWAPIVATLYDVNETAPAFVETLLDPNQVTQEWRTITLLHSGEVDLVIIRTGPGAERSMDLLERGVRSVEGFMGEPLPVNYVGLLFGNAVLGYSDGTNYGTHMVVLPEYDADDGGVAANYAGRLIAHEVAHYYWRGNPDWLDEGLAELLATVSEHDRAGADVDIAYDYCPDGDHIALLERLDAGGVLYDYECIYALGGRFFLELHRTLGDQEFREGLRRLYLMSRITDEDDGHDATRVGIRHIEDAFPSDEARVIIARWYHGAAP